MKKELILDACVGFLVGVMVGLAIIVLSRIGVNLGTGGAYEVGLNKVFDQTVAITFDWMAIFQFLVLFGIIFAVLTPFYTYSKVGLRKQLRSSRHKKATKKNK
jgi:hypothetical protein